MLPGYAAHRYVGQDQIRLDRGFEAHPTLGRYLRWRGIDGFGFKHLVDDPPVSSGPRQKRRRAPVGEAATATRARRLRGVERADDCLRGGSLAENEYGECGGDEGFGQAERACGRGGDPTQTADEEDVGQRRGSKSESGGQRDAACADQPGSAIDESRGKDERAAEETCGDHPRHRTIGAEQVLRRNGVEAVAHRGYERERDADRIDCSRLGWEEKQRAAGDRGRGRGHPADCQGLTPEAACADAGRDRCGPKRDQRRDSRASSIHCGEEDSLKDAGGGGRDRQPGPVTAAKPGTHRRARRQRDGGEHEPSEQ